VDGAATALADASARLDDPEFGSGAVTALGAPATAG
jgi:hypothetical protein